MIHLHTPLRKRSFQKSTFILILTNEYMLTVAMSNYLHRYPGSGLFTEKTWAFCALRLVWTIRWKGFWDSLGHKRIRISNEVSLVSGQMGVGDRHIFVLPFFFPWVTGHDRLCENPTRALMLGRPQEGKQMYLWRKGHCTGSTDCASQRI